MLLAGAALVLVLAFWQFFLVVALVAKQNGRIVGHVSFSPHSI